MASNPTGDTTSAPHPDEYIGNTVVPCAVVSVGLASVFVALRFYSRGVVLRRLGLEDWFILVSLVFAIGSMSGTIAMAEFGLGRHKAYLSTHRIRQYLKANFASSVLYVASLLSTKLSILALYLRILPHERVRIATLTLIALVVLSHIYIISNLLASCVPLQAFWHLYLRRTSYCHSKEIYWSNYILHIATDFLIFLLPLPVIFKLKIPRRQKIPLTAVFLAAFTVCAISVLRMVLFINSNRKGDAADFTFTSTSMANWSMIEICASIACACLPTLKPLLARVAPIFRPWSRAPVDLHDAMIRYDRPLTIGTGPSRDRRGTARRDDVEGGEEDGEEMRADWRRASFGSCSDGLSEKREEAREEEFAGSAWSADEAREGMQSPADSERPLRPAPMETSVDGDEH